MKVYDIRETAQRQALTADMSAEWLLRGELHLTTDGAWRITLIEPGDLPEPGHIPVGQGKFGQDSAR